MARKNRMILEYRDYELPQHFPLIVLTGEKWHISDVPSSVLHFHNCLEIGICHSDSGVIRFQDTQWNFSAGDITILSTDMPHTTYSSQGTSSMWSYIFTDLEELLRPLLPFEMLPNPVTYRKILHNTRILLHQDENPELSYLLREVIKDVDEKQTDYELCVRGLMLSILSKIAHKKTELSDIDTKDSLSIAPALQYMNEHYMEHFSMEMLADLCHLSPAHFRRLFAEIMNTNPLEYLNRTRVSKACTLLRTTEDSILSICEAVGFRSLTSFNRHFYAIMGEPPTAWRKQMNAMQPLTIRKYAGWMAPPLVVE